MVLSTLTVQVLYAVTIFLAVVLWFVLWQNRETPGAMPLSVASLGVGTLSTALLLQTVTSRSTTILLFRVRFICLSFTIPLILLFALEYTGREQYVNRTTLGLLGIHPLFVLVSVSVNPNDLFFEKFVSEPIPAGLTYIRGPLFEIHAIYAYLLTIGVILIFAEFIFRSRHRLYQGQAFVLVLASVLPLIANVIYRLEYVEFEATPIGWAGSFSLLTFATMRYQLIDISPIAREKVINSVRDGMLVVDTEDRITDTNPTADQVFGYEQPPLGEPVTETLFGKLPELQETYEEMTTTVSESSQTVEYGDRNLDIELDPITDDRDRHVGWVLLVQDVTEQIQRERDLEQQIQKLDQFAGLVSHDLRNPLNVALGHAQHAYETGETEMLDKTIESLDRMEAIIQDVLTLAREGEGVTEPESVSLPDVARQAWRNVDTARATLEIDTAHKEQILADETRLQRLLENLFRNSLEHGVEKPAENGDSFATGHVVRVGIERGDSQHLGFFVADNGTGIPESRREQVFEDGYTTNDEGTGLGLAIVEQIAHAHGWEVSVTESEDGGARFEITGVSKPLPAR